MAASDTSRTFVLLDPKIRNHLSLEAMEPKSAPPSEQYYWGQQWTVRPNLSPSTPRQASGHLNTLSNGGTTAAVSKQEMPIQARPDWVKEWQARQAAPTFLAARKANDPTVTAYCAAIGDAAGNVSLTDDERLTNLPRVLPTFLPGICGGAVLVGISIFLVLQLAPSNSSSTPDVVPDSYAEKKSPTSDHVEPIVRLKPERGLSGAAAVTDDGGAPSDGAAEAKPAPMDTRSSLVPGDGAADAGELRRTVQSRVPAVLDPLPDQTANTNNLKPSSEPDTAPSTGSEAGASDTATPDTRNPDAQKSAADLPIPTADIVIKGAPTGGVAEPRSRPTRPVATVVSPQQFARALDNTPPAGGNTAPAGGPLQSQPNTDGELALNKTAPRRAEPSLSSLTVPAVSPGGSNGASAEAVRERDVRDAPSTTVETAALLSRGDALFERGDIASARLFYEHAANAGDAQAAIRLGETFDPAFLSRAQVKGVRGEPAVALKWYKRAQELGASDAEILVRSVREN